jgi:heptosyltransferase-2
MATPILADLRHHFKKSTITAMCQQNVAPLLKEDPHIDEIFSFSRPSGWIHRRSHHAIIDPIRRGDYDLGVLLTNSLSSAWWFYRGHVKERIGFKDPLRSLLLTRAIPYPKNKENQHLTKTYKALLEPLGIPLSNTLPQLFVTQEEIDWAKAFLKRMGIDVEQDLLIGVNPGAAYGSAKCWLPDRFVAFAKKMLENPKVKIVFFGDPKGAPLVSSITEQLPKQVVDLAGKTTIRELMALIRCCRAILTNDSGPMHIAAALGTPLLALFGSTSHVKTGPLPQGKVIHKDVECSPCYKRTCPIDFRCMTRIETQEVVQAMQRILDDTNHETN